jgi:EPS-associated MarR family transcriptional regulator
MEDRISVHAMNAPDIASLPLLPAARDTDTARLALLRLLADRPEMSQRELSRSLGLSLGKTHYLLHALLDKGLVKAWNFTRSNNKLCYAYLLTPAGLNEKFRMTREFLDCKEREFEQLKRIIAALQTEAWPAGRPESENADTLTENTKPQ